MAARMEKKKAYIAGQIEGIDYEYACGRFLEAERSLESKGYSVVNHTRLCDCSMSWRKSMRIRLGELAGCDTIYMLKGWKHSKDAKLEHFVALKLGIEVKLEK